jgi:hypothetical protein
MYETGLIHPAWALATIFWMFAPFLLHFAVIFLGSKNNWKESLKKSFRHFPLVIPLTNTRHTYKLYEVEYSDPMPIRSVTLIENLKMTAGKLTLTEAFMVSNKQGELLCISVFIQESGPQLLLQIHIILCTGNIGHISQKISICISFISLVVAASRAFFIMRDEKRADPEPSLHMMIR